MLYALAAVALLANAPNVVAKEPLHLPKISCHLMRWDERTGSVESLAHLESEDGHIAWAQDDSSLIVGASSGGPKGTPASRLAFSFNITLVKQDARAQVNFEAPFANRLLVLGKGDETLSTVCSAE